VNLSARPKTGDYDVVKKGDYSTVGGEYKVEILQSGQAQCAFKGSQHYAQISGGPNLATGHWYTITCIKTANAVKLSVAGKTFTTARTVGTIANGAPLGIAAGPGMDYYAGRLDEVQIARG
jgi:Concanavalin A-like lectin/glucanases superfamily